MAKPPGKSGESANVLSPCMDSFGQGRGEIRDPYMSSENSCP